MNTIKKIDLFSKHFNILSHFITYLYYYLYYSVNSNINSNEKSVNFITT